MNVIVAIPIAQVLGDRVLCDGCGSLDDADLADDGDGRLVCRDCLHAGHEVICAWCDDCISGGGR
jgi:hypothetical protein